MKIHPLHSWNLTHERAADLQRQLGARVESHTPVEQHDVIAGADISYNRFSNTMYAGVIVWDRLEGVVVERQGAVAETEFPYIPGYLSFREAPALLEAFAKVQAEPDVVMLDGQGLAHPRRLGLASHVGLWLDRPCVGCAKSRLTGHFGDLKRQAGSTTPLLAGDEIIGSVVRTKNGVQPVFVSVGHKMDLKSAVRVVLECCRGYRIPEPTRLAHLYVNALRRGEISF